MNRICPQCRLEVPKDFPEVSEHLCPKCYRKTFAECMVCGNGPAEVVEFRMVLAILFLGFRSTRILVLCPACARRIGLKSLLFTALFGWLGIWMFYQAFLFQRVNLRSLFVHPAVARAWRLPLTAAAFAVPAGALVAGIVLLAVLLAGGTSSPDPFRKPSAEAEEARMNGEAELEKGHADLAESHFRKAVALAPAFPPNRLGLGYALEQRGSLQEAEEQYRKGLETLGKAPYPQLRQRLATLLLRTGRAAEAAEVLRKEVDWDAELDPSLLDVHRCWQDAMAKAGRRAEALELFRNRLAAQPEKAELLFLVGRIEAEEDPAAGRERFREALARDPGFFLAAGALGRLELRNGDLPKALEAFRQALKLRPNSLQALYALGESELLAGELSEAEGRFEAIEKGYPESALGPVGRGRVELARGEADKALALFEEGLKRARDPFARGSALLGKGMALSLAGRGKEALEALAEAGRIAEEPEQRAEAAAWAAEAKARILGEKADAEWKKAAAEGPSCWAGRVGMTWTGASGEDAFWKDFAGGRHTPWAADGFYFEGLRFRLAGKRDEAEGYFDRACKKDAGFFFKLATELRKRN